jgi:hypothetical protein
MEIRACKTVALGPAVLVVVQLRQKAGCFGTSSISWSTA